MLDEELNRGLENTLLSGFHLRVTHITTNGESVFASFPVLPLVSRCKFPTAEDFVSLYLSFVRELRVDRAAVDQQRDVGLGVSLA